MLLWALRMVNDYKKQHFITKVGVGYCRIIKWSSNVTLAFLSSFPSSYLVLFFKADILSDLEQKLYLFFLGTGDVEHLPVLVINWFENLKAFGHPSKENRNLLCHSPGLSLKITLY